jgi:hypothetical protein
MSALGTLRANYASIAPASRMPTLPDGSQGRGTDANGFLSMVGGGTSSSQTPPEQISIRSAMPPQFAYQANLIGNLLGEPGGGVATEDPPIQGNDLLALERELTAGSTASSDEGEGSGDVGNDRPLAGPGEFYSPIGQPAGGLPPEQQTNDLV